MLSYDNDAGLSTIRFNTRRVALLSMLFCGSYPSAEIKIPDSVVLSSPDLDVLCFPCPSSNHPDTLVVNSTGVISRPGPSDVKSRSALHASWNSTSLRCACLSSSHLWQCYWSSHLELVPRMAFVPSRPFTPRLFSCHDESLNAYGGTSGNQVANMLTFWEWNVPQSRWITISNCFVPGVRWSSIGSCSCIGIVVAIVDDAVCFFREDALPVQHWIRFPEPVRDLVTFSYSSVVCCFSADHERCYLLSFTLPLLCSSPSRVVAQPKCFVISHRSVESSTRKLTFHYAVPCPRSGHVILVLGTANCGSNDLCFAALEERDNSLVAIWMNCDMDFSRLCVKALPLTVHADFSDISSPHYSVSEGLRQPDNTFVRSVGFAVDALHDCLHIVNLTGNAKWFTFSMATGSYCFRLDALHPFRIGHPHGQPSSSDDVRGVDVVGHSGSVVIRTTSSLTVYAVSPLVAANSRGICGLGSNVLRVLDLEAETSSLVVRPPVGPAMREYISLDPATFDLVHVCTPVFSAQCQSLRKLRFRGHDSTQTEAHDIVSGWDRLDYSGNVFGFLRANAEEGVVLDHSCRSVFPYLDPAESGIPPDSFVRNVGFARVELDQKENVWCSLFCDRLYLCCPESGFWISVKHETDGKFVGSIGAEFLCEFLLHSDREQSQSPDFQVTFDAHVLRYPVGQYVLFLRLLCPHCLERVNSKADNARLVEASTSELGSFGLETALYLLLSTFLEPLTKAVLFSEGDTRQVPRILLERFVHECRAIDPLAVCRVLRKMDSAVWDSACLALGFESVNDLWFRVRERLEGVTRQQQSDALVIVLPILLQLAAKPESITKCLEMIFTEIPAEIECQVSVKQWLGKHARSFEPRIAEIIAPYISQPRTLAN